MGQWDGIVPNGAMENSPFVKALERMDGSRPNTVPHEHTLELAWAGARQVFGDKATPELAFSVYDRIEAAMRPAEAHVGQRPGPSGQEVSVGRGDFFGVDPTVVPKRGIRSNRSTTVALLDRLSDRYPAETTADLIDAALALAASNLDGLAPHLEQVPERARRGGRPRVGSGRTGQHKYTVDLVDQDFVLAREIELRAFTAPSEANISVIIEGALRLGLHMMGQPPEDLAQSMIEQERKRRQKIKRYYASRALRNCGNETAAGRADEILVGDIEALADRQQ